MADDPPRSRYAYAFVSSRADIKDAVRVASAVNGVKSVTNDMKLK